jgi:polyisoprenoid-binding protein YceI
VTPLKVTGDLNIKGVTKPVTLNVVRYGEFNDPAMGHRIGYAAETQINRKEFGMNFAPVLDGKFVVSNEIQINIEGEIVEVKEPVESAAGSGREDSTKKS